MFRKFVYELKITEYENFDRYNTMHRIAYCSLAVTENSCVRDCVAFWRKYNMVLAYGCIYRIYTMVYLQLRPR
jgi:hypothetical protein